MLSRLRAIALATCALTTVLAACDSAPAADEGIATSGRSLDFRASADGLVASSAGSQLELLADLRGLTVRTAEHEVAFRTRSVARAGAIRPAPAVAPQAIGARVDFARGDVREWFENGEHGVEHGLDLATRPAGTGVIEVVVAVEGDLHPVLVGTAIELDDAQGMPRARYATLVVNDANGRRLPAQLAVRRGDIVIRVDDAEAAYPIAIDPIITTEVTELRASDGAAGDELGGTPFETSGGPAVAVSGNTAVVAAPWDGGGSGGVYVFVRSGAVWSQQARLTEPAGLSTAARFGYSVALSGDRIVVGAPLAGTGRAFVYLRTGSSWAEEAELSATGMLPGEQFGVAVATDGTTAVVGARYDDRTTAGGAAYVFDRSGSTWTHRARLKASDQAAGDDVGSAVAVDGGTILVGGLFHSSPSFAGAAWVFTGGGATWTQQAKLVASDAAALDQFGRSLWLDGDVAVLGAPQHQVTAFEQGAAYVFTRSGVTWTQTSRLLASDAAAGDQLGYSVAVTGSVLAAGARFDDTRAANAGAVYLYELVGATWTQRVERTATDGAAGDRYGDSVALSADTLVVGAPFTDDTAANAGSAYVVSITVGLDDGSPCSVGTECGSGFCTDGVCCGTACSGGTGDCQACSTTAGGTTNGTCTALSAAVAPTVTCRAATASGCDVAETCVSTSTSCPADAARAAGSSCGGTPSGLCDLQDTCTGTLGATATCTANVRPSTFTCRAATSSGCDVAENCDGSSAACPADAAATPGSSCGGTPSGLCDLQDTCTGTLGATATCTANVRPSTFTCRAATSSGCDVAENCDGSSTGCPTDAAATPGSSCGGTPSGACDLQDTCTGTLGATATCTANVRPSTFTCRAATASGCDVAENCDGTAAACPADAAVTAGTSCGGAPSGACDLQDTCTGTLGATATCAANVRPSTFTCRAATASGCDVAENCDGTAAACPADAAATPGSSCGGTPSGACDLQDTCTGTLGATATCTANVRPSTFTCRPATASGCDVAENCSGTGAACPSDAARPVGSSCGGAPSGVCDAQDVCAGTVGASASCVPTFATPSTVCRASDGPCDLEEACTGASPTCPTDVFSGTDTLCRVAGGDCDVADYCSGTSAWCTDSLLPLGTVCRPSAGVCDMEEICSGAQTCPTDRTRPDGSACDDSLTCDGSEVCTAGACAAPGPLDCDDMNACTTDMCSEPAGCGTAAVPGCCNLDGDCADDGDVCTAERCSGAGGACASLPIADCCVMDADCTAGSRCVTVSCDLATQRCVSSPIAGCCATDADCGDGDSCTTDTCDVGTATCSSTTIAGCCLGDGDCDDADVCTTDVCELPPGGGAGTCAATAIPSCCEADGDCMDEDGDACTEPACNTVTARCAEQAVDCDDMDLCTVDACELDGTCSHTALDCDDMDECTADSCGADGRCVNDPIPGCAMPDGGITGDAGVSGDAGMRDAGGFPIDAGFSHDAATARGDAARDVGDLTLVDANFTGGDAGDLTVTNTCGCAIPGRSDTRGPITLGLLAMLGMAMARRRQRRA